MNTRRTFLKLVPAALGALALAPRLFADAPARIDPADPMAAALGYNNDATKIDSTKYQAYRAGQACGACALFQGKAGDEWGICPALGGKEVSAKGWCMAYTAKP